jgi:molybdate transport system permease protein
MGGNTETAYFWSGIVIAFSFLVILFINLWSRRTTKYNRKEVGDE